MCIRDSTLSEILGIPEADRQKLVSWMEFLELAQYFAVEQIKQQNDCLLYTSPSPRDPSISRLPSSA